MTKKILHYFLIIILFTGFFAAVPVYSQSSLLEEGNYSTNCIAIGECQINDFVRILVQGAQIILGLTGSLALLAFIYGGVMFLISAGSSERVNQAKQIISGAVAGLIVVFTSYMIVGFVFTALGIGKEWFTTNWFLR